MRPRQRHEHTSVIIARMRVGLAATRVVGGAAWASILEGIKLKGASQNLGLLTAGTLGSTTTAGDGCIG